MKALKILCIALVAIMLCGPVMGQSNRELKKQIKQAELQKKLLEVKSNAVIAMPCSEAGKDDMNFFRAMGIGDNIDKESARVAALLAAKANIRNKMSEFVQGVSSSYANVYAGSAAGNDVQRKMENKMNAVVEGMLNDAIQTCDLMGQSDRGTWEAYIAIEIPKNDMKKKMTEVLSKDEKLGIDFNASQFQKFMDEKMEGMLEAKKNAGY
ncbi:MAG: hypothetical protein IKO34_07285 [Bacteroidales bacterium]|nr:hypothetical protein [Bacteroidales bacterium]